MVKYSEVLKKKIKSFEGIKAIYVEKTIEYIQIRDIKVNEDLVTATAMAIVAPGLADESYIWNFGSSLKYFKCEPEMWGHRSGYINWSVYFDKNVINRILSMAATLPEHTTPEERYLELSRHLLTAKYRNYAQKFDIGKDKKGTVISFEDFLKC